MRIHFMMGIFSCIIANISHADNLREFKKAYERETKIPYPEENAYSREREELGKMLFFDPRLSRSKVMSCATCHNPSLAWADGLHLGVGHGHKSLGRRTPTILNLAWAPRLFWDGRAASLEEQAIGPIQSQGEMNMDMQELIRNIESIPEYQERFARAYPGEKIDDKAIGRAIATYERGVISGTAPFDRWLKGDRNAISQRAIDGFVTFNEKGKCANCHSGWNFTDHGFHDIGRKDKDKGRGALLKLGSMQHAFKTPTLRNIDRRAPYMHDGSENTLMAVVEFYDRGGDVKRPSVAAEIKPLHLTHTEKENLVIFMQTLTSSDAPVTIPVLPPTPGEIEDAVRINLGTKPNSLSFDRTKITVKAGQWVRLTFVNNEPSGGMKHSFVLVKPGTTEKVTAAAIEASEGKNYLPNTEDVLAHSRLLNPGERQVIIFKVPQTPGDYPYICTFPGHAALMKGLLHAE